MRNSINAFSLFLLITLLACGDSATGGGSASCEAVDGPPSTTLGSISKTDNCVSPNLWYAVYAVPNNFGGKRTFHLDTCWGGPHVTIMGYTRLNAGTSTATLNSAVQRAAGRGKNNPWKMSDGNSYWNKQSAAPAQSASYRKVELGRPGADSKTFKDVAEALEENLASHVRDSRNNLFRSSGFHVTVDECGSWGQSSNERRDEWIRQKTDWSLIVVTTKTKPDFSTCQNSPSNDCICHPDNSEKGGDTNPWREPSYVTDRDPKGYWYGQCTRTNSPLNDKYGLTWLTDRKYTIMAD